MNKRQIITIFDKGSTLYKVEPFKQISIFLLFIIGLSLIIFSFWPETKKENSSKSEISGVQVEKTLTPEPQNSFSPINTPTPTLMPSPSNSPVASLPTVSTSTSVTPTPALTPISTVTLQLIDPDGTSSFSVTLHNGDNACDNLTEAKNEGKIKSVAMTWYPSLDSYCVDSINGYGSNCHWTVAINGTMPPVGCSKIYPKPNDNIVWKFT